MGKKRGQITIFIILGIVIVITFGLFFYESNIKKELELESSKIASEILQNIIIKNYIISCLENSTYNGLELIGKQGGVIYNYQLSKGGSILTKSLKDAIDYGGNETIYAIRKSDKLGFSMLPALCNKEGKNKFDLDYRYSCETYDSYPFEQNIQDYLKAYINESMKKCMINFIENIKKEIGYDLTLNEPSSSVLIGDDDLNINLKYPINIKVKDKKITRLLDFSINPKIRLKKIHELASHLTGYRDLQADIEEGDVYENDFDIITNSTSKGDINIIKERVICNGMNCPMYDKVIILTDKKSIINGKPYVFQFAIENRKPFLDESNCIDPDDIGTTINDNQCCDNDDETNCITIP